MGITVPWIYLVDSVSKKLDTCIIKRDDPRRKHIPTALINFLEPK